MTSDPPKGVVPESHMNWGPERPSERDDPAGPERPSERDGAGTPANSAAEVDNRFGKRLRRTIRGRTFAYRAMRLGACAAASATHWSR